MNICTGKGDDGTTSLPGGKRVPKSHPCIEACGSLDELISWIGLLRDLRENEARRDVLIFIQDQLMRCIYAITPGCDENGNGQRILPGNECISVVEAEINRMESKLPLLKHFILPGGSIVVSYCHIARCVCRRAERALVTLMDSGKIPEIIPGFLNRLSDYLFTLSRILSLELDNKEIIWSAQS
jgi:cob(I)alamin adenosyltransferase